jgi:protoporphyrinogen oxidase
MDAKSFGIIGGGITGLSLAYFLAKAGRQVTVFEAAPQLGGNCASIDLGGMPVDAYYHVLSLPKGPFRDLVDDIGLLPLLYPVRTSLAFCQQGRLYPANGLRDFLGFKPLSPSERAGLLMCFARSLLVRDWHGLDGVAAGLWLSRLGGRELFRKFWLPIMRHKFGANADNLAATDMWFRINRMLVTTLGGGQVGPYYIKGTFISLFQRLAQRLAAMGVVIITNSPVERLRVTEGRVSGLDLAGGASANFDSVACTTPLPRLAQMLPPEADDYRKALGRINYMNNLCLVLKTKHALSPYYQVALSDQDTPFTGLICAQQFYPPDSYGGYVAYVSRYFSDQPELFQHDAQGLLDAYAPFLARVNPAFQKDWVLDMRLVKGRDVEAVHSLHYSTMIPTMRAPLPGLFLLCQAQIYPEPTVVDLSVIYASRLAKDIVDNRLG